jgi:hypothetical protein
LRVWVSLNECGGLQRLCGGTVVALWWLKVLMVVDVVDVVDF